MEKSTLLEMVRRSKRVEFEELNNRFERFSILSLRLLDEQRRRSNSVQPDKFHGHSPCSPCVYFLLRHTPFEVHKAH